MTVMKVRCVCLWRRSSDEGLAAAQQLARLRLDAHRFLPPLHLGRAVGDAQPQALLPPVVHGRLQSGAGRTLRLHVCRGMWGGKFGGSK